MSRLVPVWLLLRKDLRILRRSPLLLGALLAYPVVIAVLVGLVAGYASAKPRVAFVDEDHAAATIGRRDFREAGHAAQAASVTVLRNEAVRGAPVLPLRPGVVRPKHKKRRRLLPRRAKRHLAAVRRAEHSLAVGRSVASYARHLLGVPYRYGGTSPRTGFDCSGFVRFVYGHFGIPLPHSSFDALLRGRHVSRWRLRPGDLVFFAGASHVGI